MRLSGCATLGGKRHSAAFSRINMTDLYHTLTVVLERDTRDDVAEALIAAIKQMRGVLNVSGIVTDSASYMAEERARRELERKLWAALRPNTGEER